MTTEEKALVLNYKECFSTGTGKKVLDDLSNHCFEKRSSYVEGNNDKQNYNQGKRAVILYIRNLIEKDLDKPEPEKVEEDKYI
jgi:hypothetical protein